MIGKFMNEWTILLTIRSTQGVFDKAKIYVWVEWVVCKRGLRVFTLVISTSRSNGAHLLRCILYTGYSARDMCKKHSSCAFQPSQRELIIDVFLRNRRNILIEKKNTQLFKTIYIYIFTIEFFSWEKSYLKVTMQEKIYQNSERIIYLKSLFI